MSATGSKRPSAPQHDLYVSDHVDGPGRPALASGTSPLRAVEDQVAEGETIQKQVQICLNDIDALLKQTGSSRENMLRVTIWQADMRDFDGLNAVWNAWVPAGHAPARASGKAKLARPELKVEFIVDAAYL